MDVDQEEQSKAEESETKTESEEKISAEGSSELPKKTEQNVHDEQKDVSDVVIKVEEFRESPSHSSCTSPHKMDEQEVETTDTVVVVKEEEGMEVDSDAQAEGDKPSDTDGALTQEKPANVEDVNDSETKPDPTERVDVKSPSDKEAFVVPLSSPRMPTLGQGVKGLKISEVSNKEITPTITPPPPNIMTKLETNGDSVGNLNELLASTKSLSFALAKPAHTANEGVLNNIKDQKRKLQGGCSNASCTTNSDALVVAKKSAMLYFQFNTSFKKVHKICMPCYNEAETYVNLSKLAIKNNENVFALKPKPQPQGMDGDVIEVRDNEEEDDPTEVRRLENEDKENIALVDNWEEIIGNIMSIIDMDKHIEKCDQTAALDAVDLESDFFLLDKQVSEIEQLVTETKTMYDKVTGYYQSVPVILEEVDISSNGKITKTPGKNLHMDGNQISGTNLDYRPRKAKENRPNYGDDEILELDSENRQTVPPGTFPLAGPPARIPRVVPNPGSVVYAQSRTLLHFWMKAEIVELVELGQGKSPEFIVRFEKRQGLSGGGSSRQVKQLSAKQIAYNIPCPFVLIVGTRIIAKFRDELKMEPVGDGQFYAGIVAESPNSLNNYRYLVFFDDGYAQYVSYNDVLLVYEYSKEVWADVYQDSSEFIKSYIQKYPERPMVRMSTGQVVTTEWNGKWWVARVIELDCSLVKMKFENDGRMEWIYRGSTRLSPLFEKQSRQKHKRVARRTAGAFNRNQPTIEYNYDDDETKKPIKPVAKKSTSGTAAHQLMEKEYQGDIKRLARLDYGEFEGTIIKRPVPSTAPQTKDYVPHECNKSCVYPYDDTNKEYKKMTPLAIPLHLGFSREIAKNPRRTIFYRGPCGLRLRDIEETYDYLTQTKCDIPIDHFCFDLAVDCLNEFRHSRQHSFLPDLTYGKESAPVQVVNAFDYEYPPYVEYSSQRIAGAGVHLNTDDEFLVGCDCEDDCRDKSKCSCWQTTFSGLSFTKINKNEEYETCPVKGYENRRLKDHIVSGIYECNSKCKCAKTCCNRVAQNGLKVPLQVFKTAAKGWGIRPLFDVPEGAFICIYAGQILTDAGANEDGKQFGDEYLAELDYIESIELVKADYESDVTDIEEEEPGTRSTKRKEKKGRRDNESDGEVDGHANDSSYRGPKPSGERTVSTRSKIGKSTSNSSKQSDSDDEDSGGAHTRSHFNADINSCKKIKKSDRRPLREYFGKDEDCYIMDAKTTGNIGRYLNHSCQPNVFVQNVFVDTHDLRFPWVAFFASKHIRAGSELTWDYNYDIGSVPNKVLFCYCGSPDCRGRLL